MPKPRAAKLETPTARRRLDVRKKPYWIRISPGISLGYRRNAGAGTWSVRATDGHGADWIKRLALADDLEAANPPHVLDYWRALDAARLLARRDSTAVADDARPLTVDEALDRYEADLKARGGDANNAKRARFHLPSSIRTKPVALLGSAELCKWRDGLIAKGLARASVNRVRNALRAALTLAAKRDKRIRNRHVWEDDLDALPNATVARNVVLADDIVAKLIATAYEHDYQLALLAQVIAETGSRPSQVVRLTVADLDAANARLMMPRSGKGNPRERARKMEVRVPVPVTAGLTALLKQEAKGRAGNAPLLTRSNGGPWGYRRNDQYSRGFAKVVAAVGLDKAAVTLYALRHSHISRSLLRGTPVTLVADLTDTSEREIRKHYAKLISHHADEIARRALLDVTQPAPANVVPMSSGRRT
jgi:integrase